MKIIHIVLGRANPHRMNGVNRVVHNLANAQANAGRDVSVWGITASANLADEDTVIRNYNTRWFLPGKWQFGINSALKKACAEHPNATFHLHGGFIPVFYTLILFLTKRNAKVFLTPHGTYTIGAMQGNGLVKRIYFKLLESRVLKRLEAVQCLGHCEVTDLKQLAPDVATCLIPNGQNWDELALDTEVTPIKQFIIGFCGRISRWHKGLDVLLDAFNEYKKQGGSGQLHLIGDGEYKEEMQDKALELGITEHIIFYGKQFGQDKLKLLKQMNVFVHTSRNEGLPTAVIEALALGIPCIVTEMTSMDRYVKDHYAGWGLESLDVGHIAEVFKKAQQAYEENQLLEMGENAREMALSTFDWGKIAEQMVEMYAA